MDGDDDDLIVSGVVGHDQVEGPRAAPLRDELFALNDAGEAIWDQFDGQRRLVKVVAVLSPEFEEAEAAATERDVLGPVTELVTRRMLVTARGSAKPA